MSSTKLTYDEMTIAAIKFYMERKGSSKAAILKYIAKNYDLGNKLRHINLHVCKALNRLVAIKSLTQSNGTGANGRFRLAAQAKKSQRKA